MFHVAFDGFDEIRNQVVASRQLYVNLREGISDAISLANQAVVDADRQKDEYSQNCEENQE